MPGLANNLPDACSSKTFLFQLLGGRQIMTVKTYLEFRKCWIGFNVCFL